MQLNRSRVLPEGDKTQAQNVGQLIHDVLEHYRPQMADKNILLETLNVRVCGLLTPFSEKLDIFLEIIFAVQKIQI